MPDGTEHGEFDSALSDAVDHVAERDATAEGVMGASQRRTNTIVAGVLFVSLIAVLAWDAYRLARPPSVLPAAEQEIGLRSIVVETAQEIEAFREREGRLLDAVELEPLFDDVASYESVGEVYTVRAQSPLTVRGETRTGSAKQGSLGIW